MSELESLYNVCEDVEEGFEFDAMKESANKEFQRYSFSKGVSIYELTVDEERLFDAVNENKIDDVKSILSSSTAMNLKKLKSAKIKNFDGKVVLVI